MCRWTDEWGYDTEVCYPTSVACPVTCPEDEQRCYITDYGSNGCPGVYRETCIKADQVCPCGTHWQQCHDPHWDYHYCYPLVDYCSNSSMRCPVTAPTRRTTATALATTQMVDGRAPLKHASQKAPSASVLARTPARATSMSGATLGRSAFRSREATVRLHVPMVK